jgi:hypothetical protein
LLLLHLGLFGNFEKVKGRDGFFTLCRWKQCYNDTKTIVMTSVKDLDMKKILTIFILLTSLFFSSVRGQSETQYKDILVSNNIIWALTNDGNIKLFDATNGNQLDKNISADSSIILMSKDNNGNPVIANKKKQLKRYNRSNNTWELVGQFDAEPFGIFVDSKGSYFSITSKGIQDLDTKQFYFKKNSLNQQITYRDEWSKPYSFYIDKNDIIWLGFDYGEWGGDLFAFQTNNKKFIDLTLSNFEIALGPIKSFFEDSTSLYFSTGLDHFRTSGNIVKVDSLKVSILLESKSHWSEPTGKDSIRTRIDGEYIGPATFNPFNNSIYFYSQNGFFFGDKTNDLSKIENWEKVVSPNLTWKYGQPNAVGSPMNVLKLCIIDKTRFVFLSQNDGIGFYDGLKVTML